MNEDTMEQKLLLETKYGPGGDLCIRRYRKNVRRVMNPLKYAQSLKWLTRDKSLEKLYKEGKLV